jgi:hypothetical protein
MTVVANQNAAKLQKSLLVTSYPRPRLYPTRSAFVPLFDIWPTTDKTRWFSQSLVCGNFAYAYASTPSNVSPSTPGAPLLARRQA